MKEESRVVMAFFLDGAKIIFGSLVVGVFVPSAAGARPWLTVLGGIAMTAVFLMIAVRLAAIAERSR